MRPLPATSRLLRTGRGAASQHPSGPHAAALAALPSRRQLLNDLDAFYDEEDAASRFRAWQELRRKYFSGAVVYAAVAAVVSAVVYLLRTVGMLPVELQRPAIRLAQTALVMGLSFLGYLAVRRPWLVACLAAILGLAGLLAFLYAMHSGKKEDEDDDGDEERGNQQPNTVPVAGEDEESKLGESDADRDGGEGRRASWVAGGRRAKEAYEDNGEEEPGQEGTEGDVPGAEGREILAAMN